MLYTSKAVGEWLGITDRQVRNLRDQGVLSEVRPGVFDMKVCVRQYLNFKIGNKDDQARLVAARAEREETRGKRKCGGRKPKATCTAPRTWNAP